MMIIINKRKVMAKLAVLLVLCVSAKCIYDISFGGRSKRVSAVAGENKAYVAIIIDDLGYTGEGTKEMLELDVPLTLAIMPFSEHTKEDRDAAKEAGKELILHMPMESLTGKASWVGEKSVKTTMSDEEIRERVEEALTNVKYAVGINNHMGSKVMEDKRSISAVIDVAAERDLVFIDSKTSGKSKAEEACKEKGVCFLPRNVFLDSTNDINVVRKQLLKTGEIALKNGSVVAIGHVGPEGGKITAQAIKEMAPQLEAKGIEFVTIMQLKELLGK